MFTFTIRDTYAFRLIAISNIVQLRLIKKQYIQTKLGNKCLNKIYNSAVNIKRYFHIKYQLIMYQSRANFVLQTSSSGTYVKDVLFTYLHHHHHQHFHCYLPSACSFSSHDLVFLHRMVIAVRNQCVFVNRVVQCKMEY